MMADYKLLEDPHWVVRTADETHIPDDPANRDWQTYQQWLEDGGVPDPYLPPEPAAPEPTVEGQVLYDHENRIRGLEGQPPLTLEEFLQR